VLLHCGDPVHGEAATRLRTQIAEASSANATANRRFASSSAAARNAPPNVLDEGLAANDHAGGTLLLEPSHRPQPRLEATVVGLDPVVGVLLSSMPRCRQQFLQHDRVGRRPVRDHLNG
jgi:hypothetical protein